MDEFLKENYTIVTSLVEFIAAITGVLLFKKYKNSKVKYIIYFLIYAFFVDLIGGYPSFLKDNGWFYFIEGTLIERNYWWYNIFWWVGFSTIMFYVNYQIVKTVRLKRILRYGYYIYLFQVILYLALRFEYIFGPDQFVSIASLWMVVLAIIIYFFEILNSNQIILFYRSVYFYFNSIFFIWILIIMPLEFFEAYFIQDDWDYVLFRWKIHLLLNTFLYLSLASALMFCKTENEL